MAITKAQLDQVTRVGNFVSGQVNDSLPHWAPNSEDEPLLEHMQRWSRAWSAYQGAWNAAAKEARNAVVAGLDLEPIYARLVKIFSHIGALATRIRILSKGRAGANLAGFGRLFPAGIEEGVYRDVVGVYSALRKIPNLRTRPASAFGADPQKPGAPWMHYAIGAGAGAAVAWFAARR